MDCASGGDGPPILTYRTEPFHGVKMPPVGQEKLRLAIHGRPNTPMLSSMRSFPIGVANIYIRWLTLTSPYQVPKKPSCP